MKKLEKKYPLDAHKILKEFDVDEIKHYVIRKNFRVGRLTCEEGEGFGNSKYKKGTLCLYKKSMDFDSQRVVIYAIFKCLKEGLTESGYHGFTVCDDRIKECQTFISRKRVENALEKIKDERSRRIIKKLLK